jgi:hypothetical protein
MMSAIEDDEGFEGVEFHTPVGSFRAGRGRGWGSQGEEDADYWAARRRVRRVLGFYRHVATFASVILVLLVFDLLSNRSHFFVQWVALVWGVVLALHFLNVFVFDVILGREAEQRMVERELRRRRRGGDGAR